MASSFTDSFDQLGDNSRTGAPTQPFNDEPRLSSQRFDSFSNFAESDSVKESAVDDSIFTSQPIPDTPSPQPTCISGEGFLPDPAEFYSFLLPEGNGKAFGGGYVAADGPILPAPPEMEMEPDEGFAVREWRRQNAIQLEENEKREKELLSKIIAEAEDYKVDFHRRRKVNCKTNKDNNREKELLFLASQEKFHAEADKNYWKAIAELVPNEVPVMEKKRGTKDQEKKPSIVVVRGPKPGKPTDLSRMQQMLIMLKHNAPPHLRPSQPPAQSPTNIAKTGAAAATTPSKAAAVATPIEAVAVA